MDKEPKRRGRPKKGQESTKVDTTKQVENRRPNGTFAPGVCANPGGRPKMSQEEREAWQALATKCRTKIQELVDAGEIPPMTLAKFAELALDRAYGKAIQAVELGDPSGGPVAFRFVDPPHRDTE